MAMEGLGGGEDAGRDADDGARPLAWGEQVFSRRLCDGFSLVPYPVTSVSKGTRSRR